MFFSQSAWEQGYHRTNLVSDGLVKPLDDKSDEETGDVDDQRSLGNTGLDDNTGKPTGDVDDQRSLGNTGLDDNTGKPTGDVDDQRSLGNTGLDDNTGKSTIMDMQKKIFLKQIYMMTLLLMILCSSP